MARSIGPFTVSDIGLGGMPLSLQGRPSEADGIAVIHAALEGGLSFIDTADVYCANEHDIGHNERLIAAALRQWPGHRPLVATKGGLTRPNGAWEVDGAPAQLMAACERSLEALGVEVIDVYQLHAKDPKVSFTAQIEALAKLKEQGKIRHVGLSNVTAADVEAARSIVPIVSVQNRCNLLDKRAFKDGVVEYCTRERIAFLPYCPVGGGGWERGSIGNNEVLAQLGARHQATPHQIAIAWLVAKSPVIVPIPGASRLTSARSSADALRIELSADEVKTIDAIAP